MKKIKGKYIRLTEKELNVIIKENLSKAILDYSLGKSRLRQVCEDSLKHIIVDWCLVHYCTLVGEDINGRKNHWKGELYDYIAKVAKNVIEGDNNHEIRYKTIFSVFEYGEYLSSKDIRDEVSFSFQEEEIEINDNKIFIKTCEDCSNSIKDIINLMVLNEPEDFLTYINGL